MTTAATPPMEEAVRKKRVFEDKHIDMGVMYTRQGMSEGNMEPFAAINCSIASKEEQLEFREAIDMVFAKRGESLDPLALYMRRQANREVIIEKMMRGLNKENLPASHFSTLRHLLNDSDKAISEICIVRDNEGRNQHKNQLTEKERRIEAARLADGHFACQKMYENAGYGYVPAIDMLQPGIDLNREEAAARDIFRMRMMPKSPREDAILLEIAGLNKTIREGKLDPMELSDKKIYPSFRHFNPEDYVDDECGQHAGTGHYRDDAHFNRVIKTERIHHYNNVWQRANELVDDIMDAFDIRLGFVHETVGIPARVQQALNGDEAATTYLKEQVEDIKRRRAERVANGEQERPNPDIPARLSDMVTSYVPMFMAFVMGWLIASMALGQLAMNQLQAALQATNVQESDEKWEGDETWEGEAPAEPQTARNINVKAESHVIDELMPMMVAQCESDETWEGEAPAEPRPARGHDVFQRTSESEWREDLARSTARQEPRPPMACRPTACCPPEPSYSPAFSIPWLSSG